MRDPTPFPRIITHNSVVFLDFKKKGKPFLSLPYNGEAKRKELEGIKIIKSGLDIHKNPEPEHENSQESAQNPNVDFDSYDVMTECVTQDLSFNSSFHNDNAQSFDNVTQDSLFNFGFSDDFQFPEFEDDAFPSLNFSSERL